MKLKSFDSVKKSFFAISSFLTLGCAIGVISSGNSYKTISGDNGPYTLSLDSGDRITTSTTGSSSVNEGTVSTSSGSEVGISYSNVVKSTSGWQKILTNGIIHNSVDSKISGISSISYTSSSASSLDLYYGWSVDGENIIYSKAGSLSSGSTYSFTSKHPSYFRLVNSGASAVDVTKLNIQYSCEEEAYSKDNLNILMIGNSYADDTVAYANRIAASYGITVNLWDAYIASCTVDMHYNNLLDSTASYSMRRINEGIWDYRDNKTLTEILNFADWDIITFQQASAVVGLPASYNNLGSLVSKVRDIVGNGPSFKWYSTWANDNDYMSLSNEFTNYGCDSDAMFDATIDCWESKVEPLGVFDQFIPAGTAVQNLRTSYVGETFNRDSKHMSYGAGRYLLGTNFISSIYDIDLYQSPVGYIPNELNESFKSICREATMKARNSMFSISQCSKDIPELANYDMTQYTEIDAGLIGGGYWNSADSSNYNKVIAYDSNSNTYACTKRFTSSTLPIGSLIVIGDDFGYRPEAWSSDSVQSSRKTEEYKNLIVVDSSFWSGYAYRAFNIFRINKSSLQGHYVDIFDTFHIYVPNSQLGSIPAKSANSYSSSDTTLFSENGLDFSKYQRLHLDPILGFYKCDESSYISNNSMTTSNVGSTPKKFLCTRQFWTAKNELPANTVLIVDSGYQWRSDCWGSYGTKTRPNNVSTNFTRLDSSFMSENRVRTFNISKTDGTTNVDQNFYDFMNHFRIYIPTSNDVEIPVVASTNPSSTFIGNISLSIGSTFNVVLGLSNTGVAKLKIGGNDTGATSYTYTQSTGKVSIPTTGSASGFTYGTITATYDQANDRLTNVKCSGTISSYVSNNGSITLTKPSRIYNCDGTNSELQSTFKRRYDGGSGWQVDTGNTDRFQRDTVHAAEGSSSMKFRVYGGNSSYKTGIALNSDLAGLTNVKNISFWIYNNTGVNFKLRMFVYSAAGFASNSEICNELDIQSNGQWTFYTLGFSVSKLYNFQFFVQCPTGVSSNFYPSLDGICLF